MTCHCLSIQGLQLHNRVPHNSHRFRGQTPPKRTSHKQSGLSLHQMILELLEYHLCVRGSCHRGGAQIDQQKSLMANRPTAPRRYPVKNNRKLLIPDQDPCTDPEANLLLSLVIRGCGNTTVAGCSKSPSSKAAASEEPRRGTNLASVGGSPLEWILANGKAPRATPTPDRFSSIR